AADRAAALVVMIAAVLVVLVVAAAGPIWMTKFRFERARILARIR
ncbi:MAG: DUF721 domain-containing protein, partial [Roseicyclus sp.]|nr:DUF721 domain-containing protein [Roseicyclus sp.]